MAVVESLVSAESNNEHYEPMINNKGTRFHNGHDDQEIMVAHNLGIGTKIGLVPIQNLGGEAKGMSDLVQMFSNLNPMAEEFVPPSHFAYDHGYYLGHGFGHANKFGMQSGHESDIGLNKRRENSGQGRRGMNNRTSVAQRDEVIRRTVYVSDLDHQITEEQLAGLFVHCGQVHLVL